MKFLLSALLLAAPLVLARERSIDEESHKKFESGEVMDGIMATKKASWGRSQALGAFKPGAHSSANTFTACKNGYATLKDNGNTTSYGCKNLDVYGHLTHHDLGSVDSDAQIGRFNLDSGVTRMLTQSKYRKLYLGIHSRWSRICCYRADGWCCICRNCWEGMVELCSVLWEKGGNFGLHWTAASAFSSLHLERNPRIQELRYHWIRGCWSRNSDL